MAPLRDRVRARVAPVSESLIRLAVRCRAELSERVLAELLVLAPNGVEEERGPDWVEYAIYGVAGEVPDLGEIEAAVDGEQIEVTAASVPDDWADRWTNFHKPIEVAGRIRVRPSWEPAAGDAIDVVVDPGQAFGTGAHATTRLCLKLLVELADRDDAKGSLADWGTGSGVLAIAASKLGWSPVTGCDREPASLEAAAANGEANGVALVLERVDVREAPPPLAPTVVANLTAPLLEACAGHLAEAGEAPATLVCSGMLEREADQVSTALAECGLGQAKRRTDGEWAALLLTRT
jgi:ribosomal protein L11 methyltransferase